MRRSLLHGEALIMVKVSDVAAGDEARIRSSLLGDLVGSLLASHLCSSWKIRMPCVRSCSVVDSSTERLC